MTTLEIMDRILRQCPDIPGDKLAKRASVAVKIRNVLNSITQRINEENHRHQVALADLHAVMAETQKGCKHDLATHHPGSGNNDSYTRCDICGATI